MKKKGVIISMSSMLAGMMAGMLVAPKKGKELREDIKCKAKDMKNNGVKNTLEKELKKIEKTINDFTKDEAEPFTKEKTDELMTKLEDIIKKAKKKKDKVIEKSANVLKDKLNDMTDMITK